MSVEPKPISFIVEGDAIRITAALRGGGPPYLLEGLTQAVAQATTPRVTIDLSAVETMDSLGASLLAELAVKARLSGKSLEFVNAPAQVQAGLARYFYPAPEVKLPRESSRPLENIGGAAISIWESLGDLLLLTSEALYWSVAALWRGEGHRRGAIIAQAVAIGVGALPVVLTISALIGVVVTLQSADLVKQWGANIFVADGLVIAMFREMGPLMTAILLAGRSGAAIAAEIATMTVSEEIDALKTMGLNPIRFIVVPKVWGITITAPLLSVLASLVGVLGGFVVCATSLGLTGPVFFKEAVEALDWYDLTTGLAKMLVFAWLIVIISAQFGLRVKGGAEGVGRATTSAVVATIFAVIVADAALGLLFYL